MSDNKKDFYSTREAAELLGVAVSTVQMWTNNGLLKAWVTGGGHRRISRKSVAELLEKKSELSEDNFEHAYSIVIVEDSAQQTRLYQKQFEVANLNAKIYSASDGYEGLLKIGQVLPEIIITDLRMPNMDGFRMIEAMHLREELKDSLIIVVSGLSQEEIEANGGLPKGVHFFKKPVDLEVLSNFIKSNIQTKAA